MSPLRKLEVYASVLVGIGIVAAGIALGGVPYHLLGRTAMEGVETVMLEETEMRPVPEPDADMEALLR